MKAHTGLNLVGITQLAVPMVITAIDEKVCKALNVGSAIQARQAYIILAIGTTAAGNIYVMTKNDMSEFIWIPADMCHTQIHVPQQPKITIPKI